MERQDTSSASAGTISFVALIVILSAFGSYPRMISFGPLNLSSLSSLALPFIGLVLILRQGAILTRSLQIGWMLGLLVILIWVQTFSQLLGPLPRMENTPFIITGTFLVFLAGGLSHKYVSDVAFLKIFERAALFCLVFLFLIAAIKDEDPATSQLAALFLPIYLLSAMLMRSKWALVAVVLMLIQTILLESRIVLIALLIQVLLATLLLWRKRPIAAIISVIFLCLGMVVAQFFYDFSSLVGGGDQGVSINGVSINTAGRAYYWTVIFESWLRSPIFGHGYSIAVEMFHVHRWSQPHNDYLRLMHYVGLVGLGLWLGFLFMLARQLFSTLIRARGHPITPGVRLVYVAVLASAGFMIMMSTDNTLVYSYIAYPWAILVGRAATALPPR